MSCYLTFKTLWLSISCVWLDSGIWRAKMYFLLDTSHTLHINLCSDCDRAGYLLQFVFIPCQSFWTPSKRCLYTYSLNEFQSVSLLGDNWTRSQSRSAGEATWRGHGVDYICPPLFQHCDECTGSNTKSLTKKYPHLHCHYFKVRFIYHSKICAEAPALSYFNKDPITLCLCFRYVLHLSCDKALTKI